VAVELLARKLLLQLTVTVDLVVVGLVKPPRFVVPAVMEGTAKTRMVVLVDLRSSQAWFLVLLR
jgi:hypothetical protein